jgi:hypothetical protein
LQEVTLYRTLIGDPKEFASKHGLTLDKRVQVKERKDRQNTIARLEKQLAELKKE